MRRNADQGRDQPDRRRRSTSTRTRRRRIRRIARRMAPARRIRSMKPQCLNDLKRHLKQAFPRHQEPDDLIARLGRACDRRDGRAIQPLDGGMTAGEAVVFWLGGFSSDPKYPISGEGGPSYRDYERLGAPTESQRSIRSRVASGFFRSMSPDWGRATIDGYFDETNGSRSSNTRSRSTAQQTRRINFWQYAPAKSEQPYLYFDTSRHPAYDATVSVSRRDSIRRPRRRPANWRLHVSCASRRRIRLPVRRTTPPIQFVNPDKFQMMHCGIDDAWDDGRSFERMAVPRQSATRTTPADYLLFPDGPFIGEIADTIVNFATEKRRSRMRSSESSRESRVGESRARSRVVALRSYSGSRPSTLDSRLRPPRRHAHRAA